TALVMPSAGSVRVPSRSKRMVFQAIAYSKNILSIGKTEFCLKSSFDTFPPPVTYSTRILLRKIKCRYGFQEKYVWQNKVLPKSSFDTFLTRKVCIPALTPRIR